MDILDQLLEVSWRDIAFPVEEVTVSIAQDHAKHSAWRTDGDNMEPTGRQSMVFTAKIPFKNTIKPGPNENWVYGKLYPDVYRAFLRAMADREKGIFCHPELGDIICVPVSCNSVHSGTSRSGVDLTAEWKQTINLVGDNYDPLNEDRQSPVHDTSVAAAALDASQASVRAMADAAEEAKYGRKLGTTKITPTFVTMMREFTAIADSTKVYAARAVGQLTAAAQAARDFQRSIDLADDPILATTRNHAIRMRLAVLSMQKNVLEKGGTIVLYRVPVNMTLAKLAQSLGVPVENIINFNPLIVQRPIIMAGTTVKYVR